MKNLFFGLVLCCNIPSLGKCTDFIIQCEVRWRLYMQLRIAFVFLLIATLVNAGGWSITTWHLLPRIFWIILLSNAMNMLTNSGACAGLSPTTTASYHRSKCKWWIHYHLSVLLLKRRLRVSWTVEAASKFILNRSMGAISQYFCWSSCDRSCNDSSWRFKDAWRF